jgi:hypothetical protein
VDVFADGVDVANEVTADTLSTDALQFSEEVGQTGDFWGIGPSIDGFADSFSTSNQSYTSDSTVYVLRTVWDDWAPTNAQTQVYVSTRTGGGNSATTDFRVQNLTDGETIVEETGVSPGQFINIGTVNYTPTTTGAPIDIRPELASGDGTSVVVEDFNLLCGVGL